MNPLLSVLKQPHAWLLALIPLTTSGAEYVGRGACAGCHPEENEHWQGSHHDLAMQKATAKTVLGNFDDASFTLHGLTTRFFRKDDGFWVRTQGPDGRLHDYRISYAFGVYPLQQYLIEFPGGRLQALDIAWDSRPKAEGGQRWFHLHPESPIPPDDVLHWTGPNLNWNYQCADCHSTGVKKGYDSKTHSYHTTWAALDVSCEACHGPASEHISWAKRPDEDKSDKGLTVVLDERRGVQWAPDPETGQPRRSRPNTERKEIEVCAPCHARRGQLRDGFVPGQPFMDAYRPVLLEDGLYQADGQIQDEVYVWGSFVQSKMYQAGVTCSDCHDPHSTRLKAGGDQVCTQCHDSGRYATPKHHHHAKATKGVRCVECHMPARIYMGVDQRRDHSFRVPRPDLSLTMGTANSCTQCHRDKNPGWAEDQIRTWYGHPVQGRQRFAPALNAARKGQPEASRLLLQLARDESQPAIARATALSQLGQVMDQSVFITLQQHLQAPDPLLRMGALDALRDAPERARMLVIPLAWDELLSLRIQAARLLAGKSIPQFKPEQQRVLDEALEAYIQAQQFNGDRPEAQTNLGNLYAVLNQPDKAIAAYREALTLQPRYVPARIQLAQFLESRFKAGEAEKLLREGLKMLPESAQLLHGLGLFLVRQKRLPEALESLRKAAHLGKQNPHFAFVYAVALNSTGKTDLALKVLEQAEKSHPRNVELISALINFNRDAGNLAAAKQWLKILKE